MEGKLGNFLIQFTESLQLRVDTTRYLVDKKKFDYQPLPWLGINEAKVRGEATYKRWDAIKKYIEKARSLKDVGCCVGFFVVNQQRFFQFLLLVLILMSGF